MNETGKYNVRFRQLDLPRFLDHPKKETHINGGNIKQASHLYLKKWTKNNLLNL